MVSPPKTLSNEQRSEPSTSEENEQSNLQLFQYCSNQSLAMEEGQRWAGLVSTWEESFKGRLRLLSNHPSTIKPSKIRLIDRYRVCLIDSTRWLKTTNGLVDSKQQQSHKMSAQCRRRGTRYVATEVSRAARVQGGCGGGQRDRTGFTLAVSHAVQRADSKSASHAHPSSDGLLVTGTRTRR